MATLDWAQELEARANGLTGLSTTSSSKYDEFKEWLTAELDVQPAVCFLSEYAKQWTPRVGQALMGLPTILVLLIRGERIADLPERLVALHEYVAGLHATLVLIGDEGSWTFDHLAGEVGCEAYDNLSKLVGCTRLDASRVALRNGERAGTALPSFMDLDSFEQGELIWDCLIGKGPLDLDAAVRTAAESLRAAGRLEFERLRRDGSIYTTLEKALSTSARAGTLFDRPARGLVRAVVRDASHFKREYWRDCILNVVGDGTEWLERETVVRESARWAVESYGLEMQRMRAGGKVDTAIRGAINGLLRLGQLERQGPRQLRKASAREEDDSPRQDSNDALSANALRALVGAIPPESEDAFARLLETPLMGVSELRREVRKHLREFEEAFETQEFVDLNGAERLARQADSLLDGWAALSGPHKRLAQAAILYFVESEEADDDFRIGGLRTDKLIMDEVFRALGQCPESNPGPHVQPKDTKAIGDVSVGTHGEVTYRSFACSTCEAKLRVRSDIAADAAIRCPRCKTIRTIDAPK